MHYVVEDDQCRSYQAVLEFIGRRWVGAVLLAGSQGARRFSQYRTLVPGISDRLLSQRLKELETVRAGGARGDTHDARADPVQALPSGAELIKALQPLIAWSANRPETHRRGSPGPASERGTTAESCASCSPTAPSG